MACSSVLDGDGGVVVRREEVLDAERLHDVVGDELAVREPARGHAAREVAAVGRVVRAHQRGHAVVVARVQRGVPEREHGRDVVLAGGGGRRGRRRDGEERAEEERDGG